MDYVTNLLELVVLGKTKGGKTIDSQIDSFIGKAMREEYDVVNGNRPNGLTDGTGRIGTLQGLKPTDQANENATQTSSLDGRDGTEVNNNPLFPHNMIRKLSTPFDYIERILLQDFSGNKTNDAMDLEGVNFFKDLFTFEFNDDNTYGIKGFTMSYKEYPANYGEPDYTVVNDLFSSTANSSNGGFFLDSFTYTPFIDYATRDPKIGIYSDLFLTDYNCGRYESQRFYNGSGRKEQCDVNRGRISSNLYQLRNLENDIYDAKIAFRNAISQTDNKTYIYTFCEHLATLFAKLSNIRMCHEIYGFKHPHRKWEGVLALDIWYNMLYREIDAKYPFDERLFNMNPMTRRLIHDSGSAKTVEYGDSGRTVTLNSNGTVSDEHGSLIDGIEWIADASAPGYAYIWDDSMWNTYNENAHTMAERRKECVTPRGVLDKIYSLLYDVGVPSTDILNRGDSTQDFDWFKQMGKVYSDSDKSVYSRYVNLHLGLAYKEMPAKDYHELTGGGELTTGWYQKPDFKDVPPTVDIKYLMVERGCQTLHDVFQVLKSEHLFNIFNQQTKTVEEFNPSNKKHYSQGQCAVVIERIFSRIYNYLQFKSTTKELFQRHINIDSGYKYLASDSILKSDNPESAKAGNGVYYKEQDSLETPPIKPYLRYLMKLDSYRNAAFLSDQQRTVLNHFIDLLSKNTENWLEWEWNLCPVCQSLNKHTKSSVSNKMKMPAAMRQGVGLDASEDETEDDGQTYGSLYIDFRVNNYMSWNTSDVTGVPSDCQLMSNNGKPTGIAYYTTDGKFDIHLSELAIRNNPTFTDSVSGKTVQYRLAGFSKTPGGTQPDYGTDVLLIKDDFERSGYQLTLYAVWKPQYIIRFFPGNMLDTDQSQTMDAIVVDSDSLIKLPQCTFTGPSNGVLQFTYHNSAHGTWEDAEGHNASGSTVRLYRFSKWKYAFQGQSGVIKDCGSISIGEQSCKNTPVVDLTADWEIGYDKIPFEVQGELYCDVMVDRDSTQMTMPDHDPVLTSESVKFIGWDAVEGSHLGGIEKTKVTVCDARGDGDGIVVNPSNNVDGKTYPIICETVDMQTYEKVVARIGSVATQSLQVTFKYISSPEVEGGNGVPFSRTQYVNENARLPQFHIHQRTKYDGKELVFRYWKLVQGNISSSQTVLSNCVLVAVYDYVKNVNDGGSQQVEHDTTVYINPKTQDDGLVFPPTSTGKCIYRSSDRNKDGEYYCTLTGLGPKDYDSSRFNELEKCPFMSLLNGKKKETDDFDRLTMIEIEDVSNLIKSLFKINIVIAHREYFLKIDVPEVSDWWYGDEDGTKKISFEPAVEFKFSNFHAANQIEDDKLVCTYDSSKSKNWRITPVNRELLNDDGRNNAAMHHGDFYQYYDYRHQLQSKFVQERENKADSTTSGQIEDITPTIDDWQKYYDICPLGLYGNTSIQSPVDVNGFVKDRLGDIDRTNKQVRTFTSIVKKYRPIIMPNVRDIFNDCDRASPTKYDADKDNNYGVFGWCTIPSKTMVNMEYNEQSIIVPSSYDRHNRIGGSNFLQMDKDFEKVYERWVKSNPADEDDKSGHIEQNVKNTWYYLYNTRDWTYFLKPFFNISQNSELFSYMLDNYDDAHAPRSSDHINGVIFEQSNEGRSVDVQFGDVASTCEFLAKYHHNEKNLKTLAEKYTNLIQYDKLRELTDNGSGFNSVYGSQYTSTTENANVPYQDWIDDYDKTGSYINLTIGKYDPNSSSTALKYTYNLGQSYAIDDFDEDSVWFYITMVEPIEELNQVIEIEDIMPFVFWWQNRGVDNNGPTVDCYGKRSNAKLNYEQGGYCYASGHERQDEDVWVDTTQTPPVEQHDPKFEIEQRWHAVKNTIGTDFTRKEYGGTILTSDNTGNVYKGAFDPNCSGTDEKWKIHHQSNAFGTNQHEDPVEDKYYFGEMAHGERQFNIQVNPPSLNTDILNSIKDRPMSWNLWNCVRHYVYIKYFKNKHRKLGNELASWQEVEKYTRKIVKGIYRTYKEKQYRNHRPADGLNTFSDVDDSSRNYGGVCNVHWTNSFVEIHTVLERNAREHQASFVLFTGNTPLPTDSQISAKVSELRAAYPGKSSMITNEIARAKIMYEYIMNSHDSFRVLTLDGVDEEDDGMRKRVLSNPSNIYSTWVAQEAADRALNPRIYQGFKFEDLPTTYVLGDNMTYFQKLPETTVSFDGILDMDREFPESEYYRNNVMQKWVRRIRQTAINRQIFPVYTSMEGMTKSVHNLTTSDMKSITFQVVPSFYWKYEWSYNDFMIHRVGKLNSTSKEFPVYDMLGNVWEWVRDDWTGSVGAMNNRINPISTGSNQNIKVIKGGAFNQFLRKVISPARESLGVNNSKSTGSDRDNVGFRPAMTFTVGGDSNTFVPGVDEVDLFFLFDASQSQDGQVTEMVKAAKEIVSKFAGNSANKDICHVGSALFLGPLVKFMCSQQIASDIQQTVFKTNTTSYAGGKLIKKGSVKYFYRVDNRNSPWEWPEDALYESEYCYAHGAIYPGAPGAETDKTPWHNLFSTWIEYGKDDTQAYSSGHDDISGNENGLKSKYLKWKNSMWMTGGSAPFSRSSSLIGGISDDNEQKPVQFMRVVKDDLDVQIEQELGYEESIGEEEEQVMSMPKLMSARGEGGSVGGGGCFTAGTKVLTKDGMKNIEDMRVGDEMVSYNEQTGQNQCDVVARTFIHTLQTDIFSIKVNGDIIEATGVHRFYVKRNGIVQWLVASKLDCTDLVLHSSGKWIPIDEINMDVRFTTVYNLHIQSNHNYYVGHGDGFVLVHNSKGPGYSGEWTNKYWSESHNVTSFSPVTKRLYVHCGVPVWKSGSGESEVLHFGEITKSTDIEDMNRYKPAIDSWEVWNRKYDFFTYDPTPNGISTFSNPFVISNQNSTDPEKPYTGVLSNWWNGCEPVCDVLHWLIEDGYFYGYPGHNGLGYAFRRDVPRLVFVFTNEFDNEWSQKMTEYGGTKMEQSRFLAAPTGKGSNRELVLHHVIFPGEIDPPDPFCLQGARGNDSAKAKFNQFLSNIDIASSVKGDAKVKYDVAVASLNSLIDTLGGMGSLMFKNEGNDIAKYHKEWDKTINEKDLPFRTTIVGDDDYRSRWKPLNGTQSSGYLPYDWKKMLKNGQYLVNLDSDNKYSYSAFNTLGFYYLNNSFSTQVKDSLNIYLMVSDANAPKKITELEVDDGVYDGLTTDDAVANAARTVCMYNDQDLFNENTPLGNMAIPDNLTRIILGSSYKEGTSTYTMSQLMESNRKYWHKSDLTIDTKNMAMDSETAKHVRNIFGFRNPYINTTIVLGQRSGWKNFANKDPWKTMLKRTEADDSFTVSGNSTSKTKKYYFFLGLPCGYTGDKDKSKDVCDWRVGYKTTNTDKKNMSILENHIKKSVWPDIQSRIDSYNNLKKQWEDYNSLSKEEKETTPAPTEPLPPIAPDFPKKWMWIIRNYAEFQQACTTSEEPLSAPLSPEGQKWIDRHLCPMNQWKSKWRRNSPKLGKMCKYTLTEDSIELFAIEVSVTYENSGEDFNSDGIIDWNTSRTSITNYCDLQQTSLFTSQSFRRYQAITTNKSFALENENSDFVTIAYRDGADNITGTLKIMNQRETLATSNVGPNALAVPYGILRPVNNSVLAILATITDAVHSNPLETPAAWQLAIKKYCEVDNGSIGKIDHVKLWTTTKGAPIVKYVLKFYRDLKHAMPMLMSHRYYSDVFSRYRNTAGKSVVDYADEDNNIVAKPIPIMDASCIPEMFNSAFGAAGNFSGAGQFNYSHCIIDLNPDLTEYNDGLNAEQKVVAGQFPMQFTSGVPVNDDDQYKTSKIVLARVQNISGHENDKFVMGSHRTDYDLVTDPNRRKYRDAEAIVDGAVDDYATITLGNGGSYQKNRVDKEEQEEIDTATGEVSPTPQSGDLYGLTKSQTIPGKPTKYSFRYVRNKQFFIDPFELTISQWCYVKLNSTSRGNVASKATARALLSGENHLSDIERTYWEYISVWETNEWKQLKEKGLDQYGQQVIDSSVITAHILENLDDSGVIEWLVSHQTYDPLKDTRPYYFATYNNVRGTTALYQSQPATSYLIDPSKGDEYQLASHTGTSFFDVLNANVVYQTRRRIYARNATYGEPELAFDNMEEQDAGLTKFARKKYWCKSRCNTTTDSLYEYMFSFDLPTEAQWEYVLRGESQSAFPPAFNLGDKFEENNVSLDMIAWYKYKLIGSLPEPEKFCAWRISRMLFGVSKDKEQINNVYEYFND